MKQRFVMLIVISTLITAALLPVAGAADKEVIRVRGAEMMAEVVDSYAKEFMDRNPNVNIVVSGGATETDPFKALFDKEAEIVMQSRTIDSPEKEAAAKKGLDVSEKVIGWGGIVIIVNSSNPINELTAEQVRKIFSGQISDWKQIGGPDGPISPIVVDEKRGSGTDFFTRDFLKGPVSSNASVKAYYKAVIPAVAESPNATGFVRIREIVQLNGKNQDSKIKIVAVKKDENSPAVLPSRETVNNGTYPIIRPFCLCMDTKTSNGLAGKFMDFCAGKNPRPM